MITALLMLAMTCTIQGRPGPPGPIGLCRQAAEQVQRGNDGRPLGLFLPSSGLPDLRLPLSGQGERDAWLGADKLRHFLASFAVTGFAHAGLRTLDVKGDAAVAASFAASLAAGLAKEIHDVSAGRAFSVRDLVWDVAGATLGAVLVHSAH